ncbi:Transposase [Methylomagnum ishizawai]|uniref:Transposase n=1 Tax=Methylomagnum ishizawai TaxID=1760988 RepID=A0A1Y6DB92_9GAMM|nr:transposase [Methylomagnum ishizawai]SMF97873.1 Transposase [Methylomagnum ishizawai]
MLDLLNLPGIEPVDIRASDRGILVIAEALEGTLPVCPMCAIPLQRHGRRSNLFADLPMEGQPVKVEVSRPRYRCGACGRMQVPELAFIDERRRASRRLVASIRERSLTSTFHALADETGLSVNTIKSIAQDHIDALARTVRYETPVIMGIHEIGLAGSPRCVVTNLATSTICEILESRSSKHLDPFFQGLADGRKVEWVHTGSLRPAHRAFLALLPRARRVLDPVHLARMVAGAVHDRSRWVDAFFDLYRIQDKAVALRAFKAWERSLPGDQSGEFCQLVRTARGQREAVFAYWDSPAPTAYAECQAGLEKLPGGMGYSFEIIRAKVLYAGEARKVGTGTGSIEPLEYGPHIPTLVTCGIF